MKGLPSVWEEAGVRRGLAKAKPSTLSSGFPALDRCLDGGGWPAGVFTELRLGHAGIGELRLLMPLLASVGRTSHVLWVAPPYTPYAPSLAAHRLALDRLALVYPPTHKEALWAVGQALLSPAVGAVVSWLPAIRTGEFRALQRRAAEGGHWAFCFVPEARAPQPSRLRLALRPGQGGLGVVVSRTGRHPAPLVLSLL